MLEMEHTMVSSRSILIASRLTRLWVLTFVVLNLVSSSPVRATINLSHPRLWLTPQRLTRLRSYASANTQRWQTLKWVADNAVSTSSTNSVDVPALGLAYQVTGNTAYAQRAIQIMLATAVPTNDVSSGQYYGYRRVIQDMAAGYDWCFDQMTLAQQQQVATWLMDRADQVWPDTNPAQAGGWAVHDAADNYYYGYLMTWPAALAVYGDGTDTKVGAISGSNRPSYHLDLALNKYQNEILPVLNGWNVGGLFAESSNYDSTNFLATILDAHLTATGQDLFNTSAANYLRQSLLWRFHGTVPTGDLFYPFGDQPRVSLGPLCPTDRHRALPTAFNLQDATLQQYTQFWLNNINPNSTSRYWPWEVWPEFLYYVEGAPATNYTSSLPLYYFASGPGLLVRRSNWSNSATYWGIWCGKLEESHQSHDVNGFKIFKGSWLAGDANIWSDSGILQNTASFNNMTFGGNDQTWQVPNPTWPDEAGTILKNESTPTYTYFAGQAAQAYVQDRSHGGVKILDDYARKFVYVAPDTFFIYDRASVVNPSLAKEWHLHSQKPITISGRSYRFDNGSYQLVGQSLLPASGVTLSSVPMNQGLNGALSSYRLDVVTSQNQATDYMLNVLQVAPLNTNVPQPQAIVASTGNMEGALCGSWVVMFGKTDKVTQQVTYTVSAGGQTQHLILDLIPSAPYSVRITNTVTGATMVQTLTATNQGSLLVSGVPQYARVTLFAQTGGSYGYTINGVVTANGAPLANATVSGGGQSTTTGTDGTYSLYGIPAGTYSVSAAATGYIFNGPLAVTLGPNATNVNFTGTQMQLASLSINPTAVTGGQSSTGTVTLTNAAPAGGVVVPLTNSNTAVANVPASVTVPAGATSATFTITTTAVASQATVSVSGSCGGATSTATLQVRPPYLTSISINPTAVNSGSTAIGTVYLNAPAPAGGVSVPLTSSNSAAAGVPTSVTVPGGAASATFQVSAYPVLAQTVVTISGTYNSGARTVNLTVNP